LATGGLTFFEKDLASPDDSLHPAVRNIAIPATASPRNNRIIGFSPIELIRTDRIGEGWSASETIDSRHFFAGATA
jgi:hypothetical protein